KTHRGAQGRAAYRAMCALWSSSLRWNGAVTIAEPLGFLPELNVLIQRAVPGEITLGDRIECMLLRDPGEHGDRENVIELLGKTARGLSALHRCGLHGPPFGWDEEMAEVREMMGRLSHWVPGLEAQLAPALAGLEELSIHHPPRGPVSASRSGKRSTSCDTCSTRGRRCDPSTWRTAWRSSSNISGRGACRSCDEPGPVFRPRRNARGALGPPRRGTEARNSRRDPGPARGRGHGRRLPVAPGDLQARPQAHSHLRRMDPSE